MLSKTFRRAIVILFHVLIITVPFFFTWVNEELFEFPKMLLTYGLTVLITGLWIGRMIVEKQWLVARSHFNWPLVFFFGSQLLSTIFSIHFRTSVFGYYTRFHGGLLSTITYILLFYAFVSNVRKQEIKGMLISLFAGGLGVALYAIPEHFGASPSCALISHQWNVQCWVQDVQTRVFATFGQPNWLAAYAITLIPVGLVVTSLYSQFFVKKKRTHTLAYFFLWILIATSTAGLFATLLFTKSRSGFVGFGASMVLLTIGFGWLIIKHSPASTAQPHLLKRLFTPSLNWYLGLIGILIAITLTFGTPFTPSLHQLIARQSSPQSVTDSAQTTPVNRLEVGGTDSGEIRKIVWKGAIDVWKRYPLLGSGVETFAYSYYQDRPMEHNLVSEWDFLYNKAHNEFLNYLATTGIVGLTAYLVLLGWFGITAVKIIFNQQQALKDRMLAVSLVASIIALSISNFFGFSTVMVTILMFLYFAWIDLLAGISTNTSPSTSAPVRTTQYIGLGLTSIVVLVLLGKILTIWKADKAFAMGKSYLQSQYTVEGVRQLQQASAMIPGEALFHDKLAETYSQLAVALNQQQESTQAAQLAVAAIQEGNKTLELNPRHLNFYKTQIRVYINLADIEPQLLKNAEDTTQVALELAPTDAKLMYNLGLIQLSRSETELGIKSLETTVKMKPNYEAARMKLAEQYEAAGRLAEALEQYQYVHQFIAPQNETAKEKINELTTEL